MTDENRATMERAIGIIEGISYGVEEPIRDGLITVCEILDEVLRKEQNNDGET